MLVPMNELQLWDVYKPYVSPAWNNFTPPTFQVYGVTDDILLVKRTDKNGDECFRFVVVEYNFTGYCSRVRLVGRNYKGKLRFQDSGVNHVWSPAQLAVLERLYLKGKQNPIKVNPKKAL